MLTAYFDVAGFLAVVLRGIVLVAEMAVVGGVVFHVAIAAPAH